MQTRCTEKSTLTHTSYGTCMHKKETGLFEWISNRKQCEILLFSSSALASDVRETG